MASRCQAKHVRIIFENNHESNIIIQLQHPAASITDLATEIFARMTARVQTHARDTDSKVEKIFPGEEDDDDDDDDDVSLGHIGPLDET